MTPSMFSYNHPDYMCPVCKGLGEEMEVDKELIISNPELSLLDGASKWWGDLRKYSKNMNANWMKGEVFALADDMGIDLEKSYKLLPESFKNQILYGSNGKKVKLIYENKNGRKGEIERPAEGAVNTIKRLFKDNNGETAKKMINSFMRRTRCSSCHGERLNEEGRLVSILKKRYPDAVKMNISELQQWLDYLCESLPKEKLDKVYLIINDLKSQLKKLINVGLSYLALDRSISTLSGGESSRIKLASQFNTSLTNILYVMDEPTMGLHPSDYQFLIQTIKDLKDVGNTIIMVEHKRDIISQADYIIDIGPGAGKYGGEIIAKGTIEEIIHNSSSITGKYLAKDKNILKQRLTKKENGKKIKLSGARLNNLKNIDVSFPLEKFICVTGVSGSGKSSLVSMTLYPAICNALGENVSGALDLDSIKGVEYINKINWVSQQPIGRTPRSNPATYTGVFELIREVFTKKKNAKDLGFKKEHFSFNSKKGQCEVCKGAGRTQVPMHFMPDICILCSHCHGQRYKKEILEIKHKGHSIFDILELSVDDALKLFEDNEKISKILSMLHDVGLGYMKLGQSALTLSGGEAQRIKLAKALYQNNSDNCVFILDEPTTGLHFADIEKLIDIIKKLTDQGNTVISIEHNLDFICHSDWIIDLGPQGGEHGGYVIGEGTPYDLSLNLNSVTGQLIKEYHVYRFPKVKLN
jgi:excinuclease ABC subunit A